MLPDFNCALIFVAVLFVKGSLYILLGNKLFGELHVSEVHN
jgi:hypothetical protein